MRLLTTVAALFCLAGSAAAQAPGQDGYVRLGKTSVAQFLDCMQAREAALVTAHRGGVVGGLPENSMEAMAHTAAYIPTLLEVDVQRTKDGVLVLMHDDDVSRTTTGDGRIADLTWARVQGLELTNHAGLKTGARVPSLDQALTWADGRAVLQLDIKRGVPFEDVIAAVKRAGAERRVTIIVYNIEDAVTVAGLDPVVSMNVNLGDLAALKSLLARGVDPRRIVAFTGVNRPDPAYWAELGRQGIPAGFAVLWQGDMEIAASGDEARYARLADQGADILVTDRHFEAWRALEKRQDTRAAIKACAA